MTVSKAAILNKAFRQVRRHGLGLLVERFVRRKEILLCPLPVRCDANGPLEVHMQVCDRDWLNAFWTLKSFYKQAGTSFGLFIYLDFQRASAIGREEAFRNTFPGCPSRAA